MTANRDEFAAERREKIVEALSWWEDEDGRWGDEKARDVLSAHEAEWMGSRLACPSGWCGPWNDGLCVDCGAPREGSIHDCTLASCSTCGNTRWMWTCDPCATDRREESAAQAWERGASFVASSPTGLDRKTWRNPYRGGVA